METNSTNKCNCCRQIHDIKKPGEPHRHGHLTGCPLTSVSAVGAVAKVVEDLDWAPVTQSKEDSWQQWEEECLTGAGWTQEGYALHKKIRQILRTELESAGRKLPVDGEYLSRRDDYLYEEGYKHALKSLLQEIPKEENTGDSRDKEDYEARGYNLGLSTMREVISRRIKEI